MQAMISFPTSNGLKMMVNVGCLKNCTAKITEISAVKAFFSPNYAWLRWRTVRQRPKKVDPEYIHIRSRRDINELNKFVTLVSDMMFFNRIPFLFTLSQSIRMRTAKYLPTCTTRQPSNSVMKVAELYARGGFVRHLVLVDTELEKQGTHSCGASEYDCYKRACGISEE